MTQDKIDQVYEAVDALETELSVLQDQKTEMSNELSDALQKLEDERKKRAVDLQALEAAQKRVVELKNLTFCARLYDYARIDASVSWGCAAFPKFVGLDLGRQPGKSVAWGTFMAVPHIVQHMGVRSFDCPDVYPSKEAAQKAIAENRKRFAHSMTAWQAVPYESPKAPALEPHNVQNWPKMWMTGDGSRVKIAEMNDDHLFFALAKARRGGYPNIKHFTLSVKSLEREVVRRLAPAGAGSSITAEEVAQLKRDVTYERDRRLQMGQTNARLNVELDGLKSQVARVWKDPNQEAKVAALQAEVALLEKRRVADVEEVRRVICRANDNALKERQAAEAACAEAMKLRANLEATQKLVGQLQDTLQKVRAAAY